MFRPQSSRMSVRQLLTAVPQPQPPQPQPQESSMSQGAGLEQLLASLSVKGKAHLVKAPVGVPNVKGSKRKPSVEKILQGIANQIGME